MKREDAKEERLGRLEGQCSVPDDFDAMQAEELADQLDSLNDATGFSRCEIFRRAIALYKEARNVEKNNGKAFFRDANGETIQVIGL